MSFRTGCPALQAPTTPGRKAKTEGGDSKQSNRSEHGARITCGHRTCWARACACQEENGSRQESSKSKLSGNRGAGVGGQTQEDRSPKLAVLCYLGGKGGPTPSPDSVRRRPLTSLALPQPPHFRAMSLCTHTPQAEVIYWPVVRLLPMPAGPRWVQCPIMWRPAWGLSP